MYGIAVRCGAVSRRGVGQEVWAVAGGRCGVAVMFCIAGAVRCLVRCRMHAVMKQGSIQSVAELCGNLGIICHPMHWYGAVGGRTRRTCLNFRV